MGLTFTLVEVDLLRDMYLGLSLDALSIDRFLEKCSVISFLQCLPRPCSNQNIELRLGVKLMSSIPQSFHYINDSAIRTDTACVRRGQIQEIANHCRIFMISTTS